MEKVYQILYASSSNTSELDPELVGLLQKAREKNIKKGISGFLLYDKGNIIQLLEGEKDQVEKLFTTIKNDSRHFDVIRLFSGEVEKRDFPDWSMGFSTFNLRHVGQEAGGLNNLLKAKSLNSEEFQSLSRKVQLFIRTFRQGAGIDAMNTYSSQ